MNNDFHIDLEFSLDAGTDDALNKFYKKMFPHLLRVEKVVDLNLQKQGVDKILVLDCGKQILIDEKIRRTDYGDILLEEYSDFTQKKKGWLGREKHTDYIVYYVQPSQKLYLLPFLLLQKAWLKNYNNWLNLYGRQFAKNKTYLTSNIPIPTQVLFLAIKNEMTQNV